MDQRINHPKTYAKICASTNDLGSCNKEQKTDTIKIQINAQPICIKTYAEICANKNVDEKSNHVKSKIYFSKYVLLQPIRKGMYHTFKFLLDDTVVIDIFEFDYLKIAIESINVEMQKLIDDANKNFLTKLDDGNLTDFDSSTFNNLIFSCEGYDNIINSCRVRIFLELVNKLQEIYALLFIATYGCKMDKIALEKTSYTFRKFKIFDSIETRINKMEIIVKSFINCLTTLANNHNYIMMYCFLNKMKTYYLKLYKDETKFRAFYYATMRTRIIDNSNFNITILEILKLCNPNFYYILLI